MFDVIIAAGGKGLRAGLDKLSVSLGESTVISRTVNAFRGISGIDKIIVVTDADYALFGVTAVPAGNTRAESVKNGLAAATAEYVLIHDGARPFLSSDLIKRVMSDTLLYGSSVPYLPVTDSLRLVKGGSAVTVDRNDYITVQTPQGYRKAELLAALGKDDGCLGYDESEAYSEHIRPIHLTEGEAQNKKITMPCDTLGYNMKTGVGFDVHRLEEGGKPLTLGGVRVPYNKGLVAHSDGDAVIHAIMDALLSSINERDIGVLFPDTDPTYENADSAALLAEVKRKIDDKNVKINNLSVTVIAQKPKLKDYLPLMQERISFVLGIPPTSVSLSANTAENLGLIGEGNAVAALAVVSVN